MRLATALSLLLTACATTHSSTPPMNPPCATFDTTHSDPRAIQIADEVMNALGGRAAWDKTRVLTWNFFGRRSHIWDKRSGDYRLDDGKKTVLMNLDTGAGRAFENGQEVTDAAKVADALKRARKVWVNDSYWLVMPYKLKDDGVTLGYGGERALSDGRPADVLVLTFAGVGDTPENKYEVLVSKDRHLVEQWNWFEKRDDAEPKISAPWAGWQRYGGILLSSDRGPKREITGIAVLDEPPAKLHAP